MNRKRLSNRRYAETVEFEHAEGASFVRYRGTLGRFDDGTLAELFLNSEKVGASTDINARDGAIAISMALQYGCPVESLRSALTRNPDGTAMGPLGHLLDLATKETP